MKNVKIVRISQQEKDEIVKAYNSAESSNVTLEEILQANENHTLSILKQVKNIYEWKDIEKMVEFVALLKAFDSTEESVDIDNDMHKTALEVFRGSVESGKISGVGLEKLVEVYSEFKKAS